jgi:hypothetical protein
LIPRASAGPNHILLRESFTAAPARASGQQRLDYRRRYRQGRHLLEAQSDDTGPGYCHFPIAYPQEFLDQLTSEEIRTRFVRGYPVGKVDDPDVWGAGVRNSRAQNAHDHVCSIANLAIY